jgi:polyisoprenoid-binding protein YceI
MQPDQVRAARRRKLGTSCGSLLVVALLAGLGAAPAALGATARVGGVCTKAGAKSGTLVCARKAGKLVWARPARATTTTAAATATAAPTTAAAATPQGIEGAWKATSQSIVGYRVKEILAGQSTEGVGRTNSVTGSLQIQGTTATAAEFSVDMRTFKSDDGRRDGQFNSRIMSTSQFPTATLKLVEPIAFGKVPDNLEVLKVKAKVDLTLRGVKKTVSIDLNARRSGANIDVQGAIPIVFADYGIPDPSNFLAQTENHGILELVLVFVR